MTISDLPHMASEQIDMLRSELAGAKCFLEYGAGGSTMLAASIGVPLIISVESSSEYAKMVESAFSSRGSASVLQMNYVDIGQTGIWGRPLGVEREQYWYEYPLKPWQAADRINATPDVILIDGRFRVACTLTTLLFAKPGSKILFDDYVGREGKYSIVEKYLGAPTITQKMAIFVVPSNKNTIELTEMLFRYVHQSG